MQGKPLTLASHPRWDDMLSSVESLLLACARHGDSDIAIRIEIISKGKRHVVIKAGKNRHFYIPAEELETESTHA